MPFGGLYDPNRWPTERSGGLRLSSAGQRGRYKLRSHLLFVASAVLVGVAIATLIIASSS